MIPSKAIADLIQEKLGADYQVSVDGFSRVADKQVAVYLVRTPYAVDPTIESIEIRLEIYAVSTTDRDTSAHNDDIAALFTAVNNIKFTITDGANTYYAKFYLKSNDPQGMGRDSGHLMTMYNISGAVLVSQNVVAFADDKTFTLNSQALKVINYSIDYTLEVDIKQGVSQKEMGSNPKYMTRLYGVTILEESNSVINALESLIAGYGADDLTTTHTLAIALRNGSTASKTVRLVSAKDSGTIGGFAFMSLTFRTV